MKKILLLPSLNLPIPAVGGGAVEQLITFLLETNEQYQKVKFIAISKLDEKARKNKYKYSKVYYYDPVRGDSPDFPSFDFLWVLYNLYAKIFKNRFVRRLLKNINEPLGRYHYFCKCVAKKERINIISIEGQWESPFAFFNTIVGEDNVFTHLHTVRVEDMTIRNKILNSISISRYVHNEWVKNKPNLGKHCVVYNAANIERFDLQLSTFERKKIRQRLNVNSNEFLLLFCGRIIEVKGIIQLLDAMDLISDLPIKLLFIGSSNFSSSESTEFEKKVSERIKSNNKIIPMGFIHNDELPHLYACADAQIIPSIWQEGAGIVAIEGMAAGLPLITTISGGMVEYVNDEVAIQLPIDENLSQNIANSVLKLYHSPDMRVAMSHAGKENAQKYSKEKYYNNFVDIFTE